MRHGSAAGAGAPAPAPVRPGASGAGWRDALAGSGRSANLLPASSATSAEAALGGGSSPRRAPHRAHRRATSGRSRGYAVARSALDALLQGCGETRCAARCTPSREVGQARYPSIKPSMVGPGSSARGELLGEPEFFEHAGIDDELPDASNRGGSRPAMRARSTAKSSSSHAGNKERSAGSGRGAARGGGDGRRLHGHRRRGAGRGRRERSPAPAPGRPVAARTRTSRRARA